MREDNFKFEIGESVLIDGDLLVKVVGRSYKNSGGFPTLDTNFYELEYPNKNLYGRWESSLSKIPQPTVKIPSSIEVIKKTEGEYISIPKKDFTLLLGNYSNRSCGKIPCSDKLTELFERWMKAN